MKFDPKPTTAQAADAAGYVRPHERLEDLHRCGLRLIQDPEAFCFGVDAVFLSHFARVLPGQRVLDLCSGNGVIPILMAGRLMEKQGRTDRLPADFYGLELVEENADLARRSAALNGLPLTFVTGDVKEVRRLLPAGSFHTVTANPPYMTADSGKTVDSDRKAVARHELMCTLEDVICAAAAMLQFGGHFYMVHRPQRLTDILTLLRQYKLEAHSLRFIHPYKEKAPVLVLVEAIRGKKPSFLNVLPPLIIYGEDGKYTKEVFDIYYA